MQNNANILPEKHTQKSENVANAFVLDCIII